MDRLEAGRKLFDERLQDIEGAVGAVVRSYRLGREEAAELYSDVMVKVIDEDFAVLRRFAGRCRWSTYLFTVARRVLLDGRTRRWGRWRPSAVARRLGPAAVALDRRLNRDGLTLHEAIAEVRPSVPRTLDLEALADQLPRTIKRRDVSMSALKVLPSPGLAEDRLEAHDRHRAAVGLAQALRSAWAELTVEQRRWLTLRFGCGWSVRRIAGECGLAERWLYAHFVTVLRQLRRSLEQRGCDWSAVALALQSEDEVSFFNEDTTQAAAAATMSEKHAQLGRAIFQRTWQGAAPNDGEEHRHCRS